MSFSTEGYLNMIRASLKHVVLYWCAFWSAVSLFGCATELPSLNLKKDAKKIQFQGMVVSNFSNPLGVIDPLDEKFLLLQKEMMRPPFSEFFVESLKHRLATSSDAKAGSLEVAVLGANFLMGANTADRIPFLGIAAAYGAREYVCRVELNFKFGQVSERRRFERKINQNRLWDDIETNKKKEMVESCVDFLVEDIYSYLNDIALR